MQFAILDLFKHFFITFTIIIFSKILIDCVKFLCSDTDSPIYHFDVDVIYAHVKDDMKKCNTSNYPLKNVYEIPLKNKKCWDS